LTQVQQKYRIAWDKLMKSFGENFKNWISKKSARFAAALECEAFFSCVPFIFWFFLLSISFSPNFSKYSIPSDGFHRQRWFLFADGLGKPIVPVARNSNKVNST